MKRVLSLIIIIALLASLSYSFAASPGGADDPLISLSYLPGYISNVLNRAELMIDEALGKFRDSVDERLAELSLPAPPEEEYAREYRRLNISTGGTVKILTGGSVSVFSGTARITELNGTVVNLTKGTIVGRGQTLSPQNRYFAAEDTTAIITVFSDTASVAVNGYYTMTASGTLPNGIEFTDIGGHWARDYIEYLAINGLVNGMGAGLFEPEFNMNRAMFVTLVGRLCGVKSEDYSSTGFNDVDLNAWYGPYVAWAAENGIVEGYGDGTFLPMQPISREQMALVIVRFADYCGVILPKDNPELKFTDDNRISSWSREAVYEAQSAGIIEGRPDASFDPQGTATRAEVCTIVFRYLSALLNT